MNSQKSIIIKRIDSLSNKRIYDQNFLSQFTQSDIEYIFNDKNLCKHFVVCSLDNNNIRSVSKDRCISPSISILKCLIQMMFNFKTEYNISITPSLFSHYLDFENLYRLNIFSKK